MSVPCKTAWLINVRACHHSAIDCESLHSAFPIFMSPAFLAVRCALTGQPADSLNVLPERVILPCNKDIYPHVRDSSFHMEMFLSGRVHSYSTFSTFTNNTVYTSNFNKEKVLKLILNVLSATPTSVRQCDAAMRGFVPYDIAFTVSVRSHTPACLHTLPSLCERAAGVYAF